MKKTDRKLGMHRDITRRDFIHDTGLLAAGLTLPGTLAATEPTSPGQRNYPPTLTGLRGSHPGAFENAHALAREGKQFAPGKDIDEDYDLVVVGAGLSGLAAAYFYRQKFGNDKRILLLENHDDFGGHAKRNEFHQGGQMRLALGGTHNLEYWEFSDTVSTLMSELGIEPEKISRELEFGYGKNGREGPAVWFDKETYGTDRLVTDWSFKNWRPTQSVDKVDEFPVSETARAQLKHFFGRQTNILPGKTEEEVWNYLSTISYIDFLQTHGGLGKEAQQLFANANHGSWGVETRSLSAYECLDEGMPGLNLLGYENPSEEWDYRAAFFPDGNASLARLLVHALIPAVAPGSNAGNIAVAKFDYEQLDLSMASVRLRLNATVINTVNTDSGVEVSYIDDQGTSRVTARHCVMACYHAIIPHLCPDLPTPQKEAQRYQVKRPLLLTNVLVRSSSAMDKLGITGANCPGRLHASVFMFKGINNSGYRHAFSDDGPVPLTFWGSVSPPEEVVDLREQMRASRQKMLELSFADYEREVRTVLDGMLGPAGFKVDRDILAITVNRWPHGYSHDYLQLWDPEWPEGEAPHEIARKPHGNISMANSDAGADAYTHVAIDEAFRAVQELRG